MNLVIFTDEAAGFLCPRRARSFSVMQGRYWSRHRSWRINTRERGGGKKQFCVSTQHYSFAVNAFVDLIKEYGQDEYDFSIRETQTYEIIEDVAHMRSEIGILFLNDFNEVVLHKILKSNDLKFHKLFVAKPHVFISRRHPLADHKVITQ